MRARKPPTICRDCGGEVEWERRGAYICLPCHSLLSQQKQARDAAKAPPPRHCKTCHIPIPLVCTYCPPCRILSEKDQGRKYRARVDKTHLRQQNRAFRERERDRLFAKRREPTNADLNQRCAAQLERDRKTPQDPLFALWDDLQRIHRQLGGPYPQVPLDVLMLLDSHTPKTS